MRSTPYRVFYTSPLEEKAAAVAAWNTRPASVNDDLLEALRNATRWLASMHSETDEGVESEMREQHPDAWRMIDKFRAAITRATGGPLAAANRE